MAYLFVCQRTKRLQGIVQIRKEAVNMSSLKSYPLWVTLFPIKSNPTVQIYLKFSGRHF